MPALLPLPRFAAFDANGNPLAGGFVTTQTPGGGPLRTTWQDEAGTIPNQNPVPLDSQGTALIYGTGDYEFIVTDALSNQIPAYSGLTRDIPDTINATTVNATTVNATTVQTSTINATNADLTNITANTISSPTINVTNANLTNISANTVTAPTINATNVNATNANLTNIIANTINAATISATSQFVCLGGVVEAVVGWAYNSAGGTAFTGTSSPIAFNAAASSMMAGVYFSQSDARLKLDITDISEEDALAWLDNSRPVSYRKKHRHDAPDAEAVPEFGFIAQDQVRSGYGRYVHAVPCEGMPRLDEPDGFTSLPGVSLTLNPMNMIAMLAAALQATRRELDVLHRRVVALEIGR